jgi:RHS repeat-associated protein
MGTGGVNHRGPKTSGRERGDGDRLGDFTTGARRARRRGGRAKRQPRNTLNTLKENLKVVSADCADGTGTRFQQEVTERIYTTNDLNQYTALSNPSEDLKYYDPPTQTTILDGNLTEDGTFTYTWDAENRLKTATPRNPSLNDAKVEFTYDYMGRRVEKVVYYYSGSAWPEDPDVVQRFIYDGWNVVLVLNDGGDPVRKFTWGLDLTQTIHGAAGIGGLLAVEETQGEHQGAYWFFYDGNGNVGQVIKASDQSIAARYEYDPYGNIIGPDDDADGDWRDDAGPYALDNPFRFSTKRFDNETGLGYWGHRYYSPRLGRWISRDPIEERGGLNLYGFVRNNCITESDPVGLHLYSCTCNCSYGSGFWMRTATYTSGFLCCNAASRCCTTTCWTACEAGRIGARTFPLQFKECMFLFCTVL